MFGFLRSTRWTKTAGCSKPVDKAARARWGMIVLRTFVEQSSAQRGLSELEYEKLSAALNAVGDRCQTADALEWKRGRS